MGLNTAEEKIMSIKDPRTFESMFKSHYEMLVHFALKYIPDEEMAEEVVQEMFSNLWIKADKVIIRTSLKSYLFGAVRNACLNHIKHEKVKKAFADSERFTLPRENNLDFLELDELKERIDQAFEKIPSKCREIFEMSRYEGKKYQEIADELSLSIKTVENQMGKALKILREELKDYLILIIWFMMHGGKF